MKTIEQKTQDALDKHFERFIYTIINTKYKDEMCLVNIEVVVVNNKLEYLTIKIKKD